MFRLNYNHLYQVTGGTTETYLYDPDGQRVKKTVGSTVSLYPFAHYEITGSTVTKYYFFAGMRIAMKQGSTLTYLHSDHLGSTVLETNTAGNPTADQKYRAYGKQRDTGAVVTDHKFTGQKLDGTGLQYYNARYYDPAIGTFISPDTLVPDATSVFDYNRYMYVRGNPLTYNDPTGHCASASAIDLVCWTLLAEAAAAAATTVAAGGGATLVVAVGAYGYQNTTFDLPDYDHSYDIPGTDLQASHPVNGSSTVSSGVPVIQSENEGFTLVDPPSADSLIVDAGIGSANGERAGKDFTRSGKRAVIQENMNANGGVTVCENCGVTTVPAQKSQSGITPPVDETQVDHIIPRVYGGNGSPDNGQVLCRQCNRDKYMDFA